VAEEAADPEAQRRRRLRRDRRDASHVPKGYPGLRLTERVRARLCAYHHIPFNEPTPPIMLRGPRRGIVLRAREGRGSVVAFGADRLPVHPGGPGSDRPGGPGHVEGRAPQQSVQEVNSVLECGR
jgi:hypothetical protein